jgi:RNA polymerase primary sigma factor
MSSLLANKPNVTNEEDVRQYLDEIRSVPRLTEQQERELAMRCAQGDEEAIRHMVSANLRLVVSIARRYYNGAVPLPDLIQEGAIGLITAAKKFDYTLDYRFSTYASKWIRQGVIRCAINNENPVRVPAHTAAWIRKVVQAQNALRLELEREPDVGEIAGYCQLSQERTAQLLQLQPQLISLDAPAGEEDAIGSLVEDVRSPEPQQAVIRQEMMRLLEGLLSQLPERQQRVLRLHFGIEDGKCHSFEEIGNLLGVSKERARQIEGQAMRKLKKTGTDIGLEDFLE